MRIASFRRISLDDVVSERPPRATVATVLDPNERSRVEAAAGKYFNAIHARSVREAISAVRGASVTAVLVSPSSVRKADLEEVGRLVKTFPSVPMVAVLSQHDATTSERLLDLGGYGVRRLVDLSARTGLQRLRAVVSEDCTPVNARIWARVLPALNGSTGNVVRFFEVTVRIAPDTPTVRRLAERLQVGPSTFMSRFFRAGLPSPKRYLAAIRLLHASALFETPGMSISDIAYRLEYSSPQSFGRHVRAVVGMTAGEFRGRCSFDVAVLDFTTRMIVPFRAVFRSFRPL